jgi:hypothetical protein
MRGLQLGCVALVGLGTRALLTMVADQPFWPLLAE